ncbi:MAG: bifunctional transaldolase/phosoglucose isomerase, partial [Candidatus Eremiobacteraeota bacterium]|nr:bifunctional transaldolase/phosoglucose isomerase [Candidatus Eremiobacteraeota bacterium]
MNTQLQQLLDAGQSVWLDNIRRSMFASGELRSLIDLGLHGMTSNPTIFDKAIGSGTDYDDQLRELVSESDLNIVFEALAIADIRSACDEFRSVYDAADGHDGFVSLEVSPLLANDTDGTIAAAQRLWKAVDRPNLMVKIPGTPAGVPAIAASIAAGVNINVTLLFSLEAYEAQAEAYLHGMERRIAQGLPVDRIASVASVFVSRIDTAVDKLLEGKIAKGEPLQGLLGKTGIANLKLIYERFKKLCGGERYAAILAKGARVQRPLWASTSTKNPGYPELMYVENVVGRDTVNTMPPATLDALMARGRVTPGTVEADLAGAHAVIDALAKAQISLYDVTQKLQVDGVRAFADSYNAMLESIEQKQAQLRGGGAGRIAVNAGPAQGTIDRAIEGLTGDGFLQKLWKKDPAPWTNAPEHQAIIRHALGWLDFPQRVLEGVDELLAFAKETAKDFDHAVVLGMGGSSLAPDVLRRTFGHTRGFPLLHVLDSSDPVQIKDLEDHLELARTLFIVSSKSGTTTEPQAFFRYFYDRVAKVVGADRAGRHFIAITDPGTLLEREANETGFCRTFLNDPDIGGRYSALSYFGMVPAAIAGYDIDRLLHRGLGGLHASGSSASVQQSGAVRFGATIGTLAKAGRDKLTIVCHPLIESFGTWCEQLVAESTGKSGTGIVPIEGEPLTVPEHYGQDRVFVYVGQGLPDEHVEGDMDGSAIETRLGLLEGAGHPTVRLSMRDVSDIGEQFAIWEIATAAAGAVLGIDAFDQPNVQESKDNTKRLLAEFAKSGRLPEPEPVLETQVARIIPLAGSHDLSLGTELSSALGALFSQARAGDYVAITAYLAMNSDHELQLREARVAIRNALRVATTVG